MIDAAILASLQQGMPGFRTKLSPDQIAEFAATHGAEAEACSGSVVYVPKRLVKPVTQAYWAARNGFRQTVLPFPQELAGTATGLITAEYFPEFSKKVQAWERAFNTAVDDLCDQWPDVLAWQQRALNDLWEERMAMPVETVRDRCKFVFRVRPVPTGDALPVAFRNMAEVLDAQVQQAMENAQAALMEKFLERVRWLADSLADEEGIFNKGKGSVSPRDKMREFLESLPAMSLVKDERIAGLVREVLESAAMQTETSVLRTDKEVREDAALEALAQVRKIEALMKGV